VAERVTELEIKVTHLERLVETLNSVLIAQRGELDALAKRVAALEDQLHAALDEPTDGPPPHY
jgi:uncharacterized coiled-coil protein SlyX